jgi:hypothetical protein
LPQENNFPSAKKIVVSFSARCVKIAGMKSLLQQHIEIIRKWQGGEKTPELAKKFEDLSIMLSDSQVSTFDDDIYETVHEINNFINTERLLKSLAKL